MTESLCKATKGISHVLKTVILKVKSTVVAKSLFFDFSEKVNFHDCTMNRVSHLTSQKK